VLNELTLERKKFKEFLATQSQWIGLSKHSFPVQGGNSLLYKKTLVHPFLVGRFSPKELVAALKSK